MASYDMVYYTFPRQAPHDPSSDQAASNCQRVADCADVCGYPACRRRAVSAVVHDATVLVDGEYRDTSKYLAVCIRHKRWELAKVRPAPESWSWV